MTRAKPTGLRWRDMTVDIDIREDGFDGRSALIPYESGGHAEVVLR